MAISNYTELQTAVSNWLKRDNLTAQIPDFITIAESYINDDLKERSLISTDVTITPSQVNAYVDLPSGFKELISFVDEDGNALEQLIHEDLNDTYDTTRTSSPDYFSLTDRINFDCIANSVLSYKMTYYKKLDIANDTTNSILTNYPHIYLYGALLQAEPYMKNDKRMNTWYELYNNAVNTANRRSSKSSVKLRTDHPNVSRRFDINRGY